MGLRIIGGLWRGRKLIVPEGREVRPTSDRVREAIFNCLLHGPQFRSPAASPFDQAVVLDSFCGSGAFGLESLSRGARQIWFFEQAPAALAALRTNIRHLAAERATSLRPGDATKPGLARTEADLVFLDPPYRSGLGSPALAALGAKGWLKRGAIFVLEVAAEEAGEIPRGFEALDERLYGKTKVIFGRAPL